MMCVLWVGCVHRQRQRAEASRKNYYVYYYYYLCKQSNELFMFIKSHKFTSKVLESAKEH